MLVVEATIESRALEVREGERGYSCVKPLGERGEGCLRICVCDCGGRCLSWFGLFPQFPVCSLMPDVTNQHLKRSVSHFIRP